MKKQVFEENVSHTEISMTQMSGGEGEGEGASDGEIKHDKQLEAGSAVAEFLF